MARENTTGFVILGLLTHEDMTGYDIKKRIDTIISNFWSAGYGQIYPTLKQLEKEGLVTKNAGGTSKGPERIVYSITESGRIVLSKWLSSGGEKEYLRYEILLKLFFGSILSVDKSIGKIGEFRERSRKSLEKMGLYKDNLRKVLEENTDHYFYYLTVLFGEHIYKAYLEWADESIELLEKLKG